MTKKDYEAIARAIRESGIPIITKEWDEFEETPLIANLSSYFESENPRFDRARFLSACRGEDAKDSAGRTVKYGR